MKAREVVIGDGRGFLGFARQKLAQTRAWCEQAGISTFTKHYLVGTTQIMVRVYSVGADLIVVTSGGGGPVYATLVGAPTAFSFRSEHFPGGSGTFVTDTYHKYWGVEYLYVTERDDTVVTAGPGAHTFPVHFERIYTGSGGLYGAAGSPTSTQIDTRDMHKLIGESYIFEVYTGTYKNSFDPAQNTEPRAAGAYTFSEVYYSAVYDDLTRKGLSKAAYVSAGVAAQAIPRGEEDPADVEALAPTIQQQLFRALAPAVVTSAPTQESSDLDMFVLPTAIGANKVYQKGDALVVYRLGFAFTVAGGSGESTYAPIPPTTLDAVRIIRRTQYVYTLLHGDATKGCFVVASNEGYAPGLNVTQFTYRSGATTVTSTLNMTEMKAVLFTPTFQPYVCFFYPKGLRAARYALFSAMAGTDGLYRNPAALLAADAGRVNGTGVGDNALALYQSGEPATIPMLSVVYQTTATPTVAEVDGESVVGVAALARNKGSWADGYTRAYQAIGLATEEFAFDGGAAITGHVATSGVVEATAAEWRAAGSAGVDGLIPATDYYLSTTAGRITPSPPTTGWVVRIGTAISETEMELNFQLRLAPGDQLLAAVRQRDTAEDPEP